MSKKKKKKVIYAEKLTLIVNGIRLKPLKKNSSWFGSNGIQFEATLEEKTSIKDMKYEK